MFSMGETCQIEVSTQIIYGGDVNVNIASVLLLLWLQLKLLGVGPSSYSWIHTLTTSLLLIMYGEVVDEITLGETCFWCSLYFIGYM